LVLGEAILAVDRLLAIGSERDLAAVAAVCTDSLEALLVSLLTEASGLERTRTATEIASSTSEIVFLECHRYVLINE
jgi:hypothetical protein